MWGNGRNDEDRVGRPVCPAFVQSMTGRPYSLLLYNCISFAAEAGVCASLASLFRQAAAAMAPPYDLPIVSYSH